MLQVADEVIFERIAEQPPLFQQLIRAVLTHHVDAGVPHDPHVRRSHVLGGGHYPYRLTVASAPSGSLHAPPRRFQVYQQLF